MFYSLYVHLLSKGVLRKKTVQTVQIPHECFLLLSVLRVIRCLSTSQICGMIYLNVLKVHMGTICRKGKATLGATNDHKLSLKILFVVILSN